MTQNIAVTGYSGTGSSAVVDYLKEKNNFKVALADNYEHVPLYFPNGVFDFYDKLIRNNDPLRSDEAIKEFRNTMNYLAVNNFGWFGSYDAILGNDFNTIVSDFLKKVTGGKIQNTFWYYNYKKVKFSLSKCCVQLFAKFILKRKIYKWGRSYVIEKGDMEYSFINNDDLIDAIKEFISDYARICRKDETNNYIFDHFVWPSQVNKIEMFDDSFKFIILHRDPRDLFFINKYYWCSPKVQTPGTYPLDVHEFCNYFKGLKKALANNSDRVLNVNFEDLVYKYEETTTKIDEFLGIETCEENKYMYFDPKKSISNTQSYVGKNEYKEELNVIEEELADYLYDFPYDNETSIKDMFL